MPFHLLLASSVTALPLTTSPRSSRIPARALCAYKKYAVGGAFGALGSFFLRCCFFFLAILMSPANDGKVGSAVRIWSSLAPGRALVKMLAVTAFSSAEILPVPPRTAVVWLRYARRRSPIAPWRVVRLVTTCGSRCQQRPAEHAKDEILEAEQSQDDLECALQLRKARKNACDSVEVDSWVCDASRWRPWTYVIASLHELVDGDEKLRFVGSIALFAVSLWSSHVCDTHCRRREARQSRAM